MSIEEDDARVSMEQLLADSEHARLEFFDSIAELEAIIGDIPSGIPAPDGAYRIRNCAKVRDTAYARYKAALQRVKDRLENSNL